MDVETARQLIAVERERINSLLLSVSGSRSDDNAAESDAGDGDIDAAQPLEHEGVDIAIEGSLREGLAALVRAEERIANGTYGRSVESGRLIPDERLEANPAAELTVDEAAKHPHRDY
jgi:DnaK suppressor protein